jgi:hypothetical protein
LPTSQISSRVESKSIDRAHLRSAEPSSALKEKYKMYREPGDNNSIGIGMLAKNALPPKNRPSI